MKGREFLGSLEGLPYRGIDGNRGAEMFASVDHAVSDTADFAHIRQNSPLAIYEKGQQGMHRLMMIPQRRFVQKGFPSPHIMLKQGVGHADTVCLARSQDFIALHRKEFVFKR
jgi:hypothetical protein